jgi:hypothetical protein
VTRHISAVGADACTFLVTVDAPSRIETLSSDEWIEHQNLFFVEEGEAAIFRRRGLIEAR